MATGEFRDAALVLLAHGSTVNADSSAPAWQHAEELRRRALFAEVTAAFWKQEPSIADVLDRVTSPRVFLVPLFISDGWFAGKVIPEALGFLPPGSDAFVKVQARHSRRLYYCSPVGSHASMTGVLAARAREVVDRHPFPRRPVPAESALFIAGHGTAYSRGSHDAIVRQVERFRVQGTYAEVHAVFLEEEPRISDCWSMAAATNLVLVPFFISNGLHIREDIPVMLGESRETVTRRVAARQVPWRNPTERHRKRLWLADAVGTEPLLAEVILERVREAALGSVN